MVMLSGDCGPSVLDGAGVVVPVVAGGAGVALVVVVVVLDGEVVVLVAGAGVVEVVVDVVVGGGALEEVELLELVLLGSDGGGEAGVDEAAGAVLDGVESTVGSVVVWLRPVGLALPLTGVLVVALGSVVVVVLVVVVVVLDFALVFAPAAREP